MIKIISLSQIEINGSNVGDIVAVAKTHPEMLPAISIELRAYESHLRQFGGDVAQKQWDEIEQLRAELAPDIASLIIPLQEAGLTAWGDAAVTAGENLMPLVLRLLAIASRPRYWHQCQEIKDLFGAIGQASGVWPTSEQATAMQTILDVGTAATGPVTAKWLDFTPWMN